jgi:hypothetical protein
VGKSKDHDVDVLNRSRGTDENRNEMLKQTFPQILLPHGRRGLRRRRDHLMPPGSPPVAKGYHTLDLQQMLSLLPGSQQVTVVADDDFAIWEADDGAGGVRAPGSC